MDPHLCQSAGNCYTHLVFLLGFWNYFSGKIWNSKQHSPLWNLTKFSRKAWHAMNAKYVGLEVRTEWFIVISLSGREQAGRIELEWNAKGGRSSYHQTRRNDEIYTKDTYQKTSWILRFWLSTSQHNKSRSISCIMRHMKWSGKEKGVEGEERTTVLFPRPMVGKAEAGSVTVAPVAAE